jgi:hypothetical protein
MDSAPGNRVELCINASVVFALLLAMSSGIAVQTIEGQVMSGGAPISGLAVTLWSASPSAPKQLAQAQTATTVDLL